MGWLIFAGVLLTVALVATQISPRPTAEDALMGRATRLLLMLYLLVLSVVVVYALIRLSALDYPNAPVTIQGQGDPDVTALSKLPGPKLFYAMPHLTPGSAVTYELALYGSRFGEKAKVRLNGIDHPPKFLAGDNFIRVVPENKVLIGTTVLVAEVVNPDGARTNALMLAIDRPKVMLYIFGRAWPITREIQLVLLVLCGGALGTFLHAVGSLANYIGNRTAVQSWFWWYVTRPFLGSSMALVFYAVMRGGFLTGTSADIGVVNHYGAVAIAALVGMFSDRAAQKLKEIFDTLFKSDDKRANKIEDATIEKLVPSTVRPGTGKPIEVKIVGDRLSRAMAVKVNGEKRTADKIEEKEIVLKLTADDTKNAGALTISVETPHGTPQKTLWVSDLDITTATLPAGKVNADYKEKLTATGAADVEWSMANGPAGLKLDASSGELAGKPTKAGTVKTAITVKDKKGPTVTRDYDIVIAP